MFVARSAMLLLSLRNHSRDPDLAPDRAATAREALT